MQRAGGPRAASGGEPRGGGGQLRKHGELWDSCVGQCWWHHGDIPTLEHGTGSATELLSIVLCRAIVC